MPAPSSVSPDTASAAKFAESAFSASVQRNTPPFEAPVTATRTPSAYWATKAPTSAKREAGCSNLAYAARWGTGKRTSVMISPSSSAVSNMPVK